MSVLTLPANCHCPEGSEYNPNDGKCHISNLVPAKEMRNVSTHYDGTHTGARGTVFYENISGSVLPVKAVADPGPVNLGSGSGNTLVFKDANGVIIPSTSIISPILNVWRESSNTNPCNSRYGRTNIGVVDNVDQGYRALLGVITIPTTGTYSLGFSVSNCYKIYINDILTIAYDHRDNGYYSKGFWNVFELDLPAGNHNLRIEFAQSLHPDIVAAQGTAVGVGFELYNRTIAQLQAIATDAELTPYILHTTRVGLTRNTQFAVISNNDLLRAPYPVFVEGKFYNQEIAVVDVECEEVENKCDCPEGYVKENDNTCSILIPAVYQPIGGGINLKGTGSNGTVFYENITGKTITANETAYADASMPTVYKDNLNNVLQSTLLQNDVWINTNGNMSNGRYSRSNVGDLDHSNPGVFRAILTELDIPQTGVYSFGISAINKFKVYINNQLIINNSHIDDWSMQYGYWNIFEFELTEGKHDLRVEFALTTNSAISNVTGNDVGVGVEVYNATITQLKAITTETALNPFILYTSRNSVFTMISNGVLVGAPAGSYPVNIEGTIYYKQSTKITPGCIENDCGCPEGYDEDETGVCKKPAVPQRGNGWYFGYKQGVTFNELDANGDPTPLIDGLTQAAEGCATASDEQGNLVFYTDGISLWNKNHVLQASDLKGSPSSTNSALVKKLPGSNTIFYIFTVGSCTGGTPSNQWAGRYSIYDSSLNNGDGGFVSKNNLLAPGDTIRYCEKIAAITEGDKTWIIYKNYDPMTGSFSNLRVYISYPLTAAGLGARVINTVTSGPDYSNNQGQTKFNIVKLSNGLYQFVECLNRNVNFCNFDFATGLFTQPTSIGQGPPGDYLTAPYGAEFSPNGKYLYISEAQGVGAPVPSQLSQYDVSSNVPATIKASRKVIATITAYGLGALQLGPNQRIYMAGILSSDPDRTHLSVIYNPDEEGTACDFRESFLLLATGSGHQVGMGLPTFEASTFEASTFVAEEFPAVLPLPCAVILRDCAGIKDDIFATGTGLKANVGKTITVIEYPDTCFEVISTTLSNDTIVVTIDTIYDDCETCLPTCHVLTNCKDSLETITTSTVLTPGDVVTLEGHPGKCWTVSDAESCNFGNEAVVVLTTFADCETCLPKCYGLTDCEGIREAKATNQDLSAVKDKIIKWDDTCWVVTESTQPCIGVIDTVITEVIAYNTCEECTFDPCPIDKPYIEPGFHSNCDPEKVIAANCNYAGAIHKDMISKKYGIESCCAEDLDKAWLRKEIIDLGEMEDPTLCTD